jgi:acetylornithine deacetylase
VLDARFQADPGFAYVIEQVEPAPPFGPELNGPLSERVAGLLRDADIDARVQGAPYTTNANHYAAAGLASVVLGPGDIAQAHTKDEWIALEQLELGVRGYRKLMESLPEAGTL